MVVCLGIIAVVVGLVAAVGNRSAATVDSAAVTAYQKAIRPAIQHWGQIEVLGMRPAIVDLRNGTGPPAEAIAGEAAAWQRGLHEIDDQLRQAVAPGPLRDTSNLFRQAVSLYLQAAAQVEAAASGDASTRIALIDRAVSNAMHGDCVYDDASVQLQHLRGQAGLGTTDEFPTAPCAGATASASAR